MLWPLAFAVPVEPLRLIALCGTQLWLLQAFLPNEALPEPVAVNRNTFMVIVRAVCHDAILHGD